MCVRHSHTQLGTPMGAVPVAKTVGTGAPPGHRATTRCCQDRRPGIGFRAKHQVSGWSRRQSPHRVCCVLVGAARQPVPPSRRVHADLPSVRAPRWRRLDRKSSTQCMRPPLCHLPQPQPFMRSTSFARRFDMSKISSLAPAPALHLRSPPFRIRFRSSLYLVFTFLVSNPKVAHVPADGTDQAGPAAAYGLGAHPPRGRGPKLDTA